jgi:hypothetical protein
VRRTRTWVRRLAVVAVAVLVAAGSPTPASGREGAPVIGMLVERTVTEVVTVHADGRPPEGSELQSFERRVDPSGRTISEGSIPVARETADSIGVFGCSGRGNAEGFRDHSQPAGPVHLDLVVAGAKARSVFHVYSLAEGRTVGGRPATQVLVCMAGGGQARDGRRLLQAGMGAAYDDTENTHILGKSWLDGTPAARDEAGFSFFGAADTGADGWVEQEPAGKVEGSMIGPFPSAFDDYFRNAAAGWWQHPCVDDGPVCGPADGSTVFQGSLAGAVWEFYDEDAFRDHRFRVALFLTVNCPTLVGCP